MDLSEDNSKPLSFPRPSDLTQHDSRSSLNVTTTISQDRSEEFDLVTSVKIAEDNEQGTAKTLRTTGVAHWDHIGPTKDFKESSEANSDSEEEGSNHSDSAAKEVIPLVNDTVPGLPNNGERRESATLSTGEITAALGVELYGDGPHSHLFQYLLTTISKLELERRALEQQLRKFSEPESPAINENSHDALEKPQEATDSRTTYIWEAFHRVEYHKGDAFFRDVPRKFKGDTNNDSLRGRDETENMLKYLERHESTAFAVIYHYSDKDYTGRKAGVVSGRMIQDGPPAKSHGQYIQFAEKTRNAIKAIIAAHPEEFKDCSVEKPFRLLIAAPYLIFYHHNQAFLRLRSCSGLEEKDQTRIKLLCDWFEENWRSDWDEANALLDRGKVNNKHYGKLFRGGDIWVKKDDDGLIHAKKLEPYPWFDYQGRIADAFGWYFNGSFVRERFPYWTVDDRYFIIKDEEEVDITSLTTYPIRFAKSGTYEKLVSRGEKFWKCRKRKLISFQEAEDPTDGEIRYIVDYHMLKRMHPHKAIFQNSYDDLGKEAMDAQNPPDDDFLVLLPSHIHAFNLHRKHWLTLPVERITNVTWNKDAFERLEAPPKTKEMIQAMVAAQTSDTKTNTDLIAGKGNGLLILLHGPPGTGKTLTAESIADMEEKPLYRVTCADIGMEPESVEKYLQTIFEIGTAWGCVILIDEADVFIEERNFADMKRNALISVFLRAIEYFNGILILTTNRVGTFDAAFKSRIQLALRYRPLDQDQRRRIWSNFFRMLRNTKERVDVDDLEMNVEKLARIDMNGRQIRNTVTTARHLAKFRKERLVYEHVQDAVETVTDFDKYLDTIRGVPEERWAREDKLR